MKWLLVACVLAMAVAAMATTTTTGTTRTHPMGVSSARALRNEPLLALVRDTTTGAFTWRSTHTDTAADVPRLPHESVDAWGKWADDIDKSGWAFLELHSNGSLHNNIQARAAGYFEGHISQLRIWQEATNLGFASGQVDTRVGNFIKAQLAWVAAQIAANPRDDYWHQVELVEAQLLGLHEGYNKAAPANQQLSLLAIRLLTMGAELEDIEAGVVPEVCVSLNSDADDRFSHCSALLKWLPDRSDILISQVTWSTFNSMLRVYKLYDFPYHNHGGKSVAARYVSFSSYPGCLNSGDDFYLLSSNMVTQETTIGVYNDTVYKTEIKPNTVPEYIRNIVANKLANSGQEWSDIFSRFNSGTYNNQWMILDYKRFTPGKDLAPGLFWFCEQMPGFIESADLTGVLARDSYFGAYNVAYFKSVMDKSGGSDMVKKYGPWYSYENTARAQIFRRDHSKVTDVEGMKKIMRWNDFKNDPLSRCDGCTPPYTGENAIAARCDLNDPKGIYPIEAWGFRDHCGTDAKITSSQLAMKFQVVIQSGPTYDNLPPFVFSTSPFANTSHIGLPDRWQFPWVVTQWKPSRLA